MHRRTLETGYSPTQEVLLWKELKEVAEEKSVAYALYRSNKKGLSYTAAVQPRIEGSFLFVRGRRFPVGRPHEAASCVEDCRGSITLCRAERLPPVVFRRYPDGLVAIFIEEPVDIHGDRCFVYDFRTRMCGSAFYDEVVKNTKDCGRTFTDEFLTTLIQKFKKPIHRIEMAMPCHHERRRKRAPTMKPWESFLEKHEA